MPMYEDIDWIARAAEQASKDAKLAALGGARTISPQEAIELFKAGKTDELSRDQAMANEISRAAGYYKEGQFTPQTASLSTLQQAQNQWADDTRRSNKSTALTRNALMALMGGAAGAGALGFLGEGAGALGSLGGSGAADAAAAGLANAGGGAADAVAAGLGNAAGGTFGSTTAGLEGLGALDAAGGMAGGAEAAANAGLANAGGGVYGSTGVGLGAGGSGMGLMDTIKAGGSALASKLGNMSTADMLKLGLGGATAIGSYLNKPDYAGNAAKDAASSLDNAARQTGWDRNFTTANEFGDTRTSKFDPTTGQTNITSAFSPERQALFDNQRKNALALNQGASGMIGGLQNLLAKPNTAYDPKSVEMNTPTYPAPSAQGGFGNTRPLTPEEQQAKLLRGY